MDFVKKLLKEITFYAYFLSLLFAIIGMASNYSGYLSAYCRDSTNLDIFWDSFAFGFIAMPLLILVCYFIKSIFNSDWNLIPFYKNKDRKIWWLPILMILLTIIFSTFLIIGSLGFC